MRISVRPGYRKKKILEQGSGTANLGEIFKGLGSFVELLADMEKKGQEEVKKTGEIKLPGGRAMYGFSVKIGGLGHKIEHFGNIVRETEKGPVVEEAREPFVDVFEEAEQLEVIAELPGIEEKDISFEIKDDVLVINAEGDGRKYSKEVLLPCKAAVLKTAYKNGVFKLTLKKEEK